MRQILAAFFSNELSEKRAESILCFDTASQIMPFLRECFFTPLRRTIKNSGQARSGREERLEQIIKKRKGNKKLKLPSFRAVFNCLNPADREKDKSNYRFLKVLKIMAKKASNFRV